MKIEFPNFTLEELLESETAHDKRIDNYPSWDVVHNLIELTSTILQPLRTAWGGAIEVKSGFRCKELNDKIKGASKTSVHMKGYAADLWPSNGKFAEFVLFTQKFLQDNNIAFDQLIIEKSGKSQWLHIGLKNNAGQQRRQFKSISK